MAETPDPSAEMNPLLKLVLQLGVPAAIAVYLVYNLAGNFNASVMATQGMVATHTAQTVEMARKIDLQQASLDVLIQIQKTNCLHQSHGSMERSECYEASKR